MLDAGRRHPIVWISGPAGSGKTMLASSYVESRKLPCLWYQMDEGDSDLATFFYYMGLAGKNAAPRKKKPLPLLTPEYMPGLPTFSRRFFEDLTGRLHVPSVIVLDNYQEVPTTAGLHEALLHGFSSIPEGVTVVVLSRAEPPGAFARLLANNTVSLLQWEDLRLTEAESKALARLHVKTHLSRQAYEELHERTAGWAAGVVLLMKRHESGAEIADEHWPAAFGEDVFDYFAGEIFQRTDTEMQNFLLRTSFLPSMTAGMAKAMSGQEAADMILRALCRNNYFTYRRAGPEPAYQFHPLFREFLLARAKEKLSLEDVAELERNAARLLELEGRFEEAAELLIEAEDWQLLIRLILNQAPLLAGQGRFGLLEGWLKRIPRELVDNTPWVLYWKGLCRLPFDQKGSEKHFERAFERFYKIGDAAGVFLSWSGIVDSITWGFEDFKRLDPWISRLSDIMERFGLFPAGDIGARVASSMFMALIHRQPAHPEFDKWAELALERTAGDAAATAQTLLQLSYNSVALGDVAGVEHSFDLIKAFERSSKLSPMARLSILLAKIMLFNFAARRRDCLEAVREAMELARRSGVHVMDLVLLGNAVMSALGEEDEGEADRLLEEMSDLAGEARPWDTGFYHFLVAWSAFLKNRLTDARRHIETVVALVTQLGDVFSIASGNILKAYILYASGEEESAVACIGRLRRMKPLGRSSHLEFMCLLALAHFSLDGDRRSAVRYLRKAMALGKKEGYITTHFPWIKPVMSRLCAAALEEGIEVDYVRDLIRRRGLTLESPSLHIENWPWRLKVYTLGRFSAVFDGKPLAKGSGKAGKPLEMLKLLVAFGGRDVSEARVADTLWPEAEGDAARQSFTTTLHRLRRLVGDDTVILKDGRLTLSPQHCWADAWAFERLVSETETVDRETTAESLETTEAAFQLYKGPFLSGGPDTPWAAGVRERLRSKFVRLALKMGRYWERSDRFDRAVECYQKGIEVDCLVEEFHERLMECYSRLGRKAEALAAYRRCEETLAGHLEIEPSERMKARFRELMGTRVPAGN